MYIKTFIKKALLPVILAGGMTAFAQTNEMIVQAGKLGAPIQPTMYGLFFEDIFLLFAQALFH